MSKSCDKAVFKIKGRPTLFIPLKEVSIKQVSNDDLFDGRGQNKDTLTKQKKVIEEKKRRTLANKKIFEDLERQADEDMLKDSERIKGKGRIFGGRKSLEAKQYRLVPFEQKRWYKLVSISKLATLQHILKLKYIIL